MPIHQEGGTIAKNIKRGDIANPTDDQGGFIEAARQDAIRSQRSATAVCETPGDPVGSGCLKKWALWSGGKDSVAALDVLERRGELAGVIALDTRFAVDGWRDWIESTAAKRGWPLTVLRTPEDPERIIRKYGFARPGSHKWFMRYLKGRQIADWHRKNPDEVLASGVRKGESKKRSLTAKPVSTWEGATVVAPILEWTTPQVWEYVRKRSLPLSPSYETMRISGDSLCGAHADPREAPAIAAFYPEIAARIAKLEADPVVKSRAKCSTWGGGYGVSRARRLDCFTSCEVPA